MGAEHKPENSNSRWSKEWERSTALHDGSTFRPVARSARKSINQEKALIALAETSGADEL